MSKISFLLSRHPANPCGCCELTLPTPELWGHGHFHQGCSPGQDVKYLWTAVRAFPAGFLTEPGAMWSFGDAQGPVMLWVSQGGGWITRSTRVIDLKYPGAEGLIDFFFPNHLASTLSWKDFHPISLPVSLIFKVFWQESKGFSGCFG